MIGVDPHALTYEAWGSPEPELPLARTFEQMPGRNGTYFCA